MKGRNPVHNNVISHSYPKNNFFSLGYLKKSLFIVYYSKQQTVTYSKMPKNTILLFYFMLKN